MLPITWTYFCFLLLSWVQLMKKPICLFEQFLYMEWQSMYSSIASTQMWKTSCMIKAFILLFLFHWTAQLLQNWKLSSRIQDCSKIYIRTFCKREECKAWNWSHRLSILGNDWIMLLLPMSENCRFVGSMRSLQLLFQKLKSKGVITAFPWLTPLILENNLKVST